VGPRHWQEKSTDDERQGQKDPLEHFGSCSCLIQLLFSEMSYLENVLVLWHPDELQSQPMIDTFTPPTVVVVG
jgi:hypothetical protein